MARPRPAPRKHGFAKATAVIVSLGFLSMILMGFYGEYSGDSYEKIETQVITENTFFELSGDFLFENEIFTVELTKDGHNITFSLNDSISSNADYYLWYIFDCDRVASTSTYAFLPYEGEYTSTTSPVFQYPSNVGKYEIRVDCFVFSDNDQYVLSATYSGTVTYVGIITNEYKWRYQSTVYIADVTFSYDEYRYYRDMDSKLRALSMKSYGKVVSFVTYDCPAVKSLAESLRKSYGIFRDTTDQAFAAFVLAFVQICFDYPPYSGSMLADKYQYGQDEYFAYPLETIFYGAGDCEDTSILTAALFKALGYNAGVFLLPDHAVAAVGLDSYKLGTLFYSNYEILSVTVGGTKYYGCETTVSMPQEIGLITLTGYGGHPYSWYMGKQGCGLYVV
jgi:transglutaminase-like putative cysteine protease